MKRYAWILVVPLAAGLPCASQDEPVGALKLKILDVVYTIKDFGGKVLDLKVKETDTELRIELAADVLFDFDNAYNQKLSVRRADAVKAWLMRQADLKRINFVTAGFGATRPVAPNTKPDGSDDPDGRQEMIISERLASVRIHTGYRRKRRQGTVCRQPRTSSESSVRGRRG
jgi:OmpA family